MIMYHIVVVSIAPPVSFTPRYRLYRLDGLKIGNIYI
jgi:hypothetical protein